MPSILEFSGPLWFWKGPAPHYFVTVPAAECLDIKAAARLVTYGWGMIPVRVQMCQTGWTTSLFPKDGLYILPVKASVRRAENLAEGDVVTVQMALGR
ncbi:DUF1905 domain-containing protein [Deinococcus rubellus]|uniref:DUF1905 domain-containing protein n=1 Tax=Deinococcus rubellus TaxID=1889240 RepID=A0ABY5YGY3_9DEIO|nr:DUF1905 domain-containing protein [Deinococcus rubellus]UWX64075.1 DUF1905 domain-containing protein [Deinococcus rubellus]